MSYTYTNHQLLEGLPKTQEEYKQFNASINNITEKSTSNSLNGFSNNSPFFVENHSDLNEGGYNSSQNIPNQVESVGNYEDDDEIFNSESYANPEGGYQELSDRKNQDEHFSLEIKNNIEKMEIDTPINSDKSEKITSENKEDRPLIESTRTKNAVLFTKIIPNKPKKLGRDIGLSTVKKRNQEYLEKDFRHNRYSWDNTAQKVKKYNVEDIRNLSNDLIKFEKNERNLDKSLVTFYGLKRLDSKFGTNLNIQKMLETFKKPMTEIFTETPLTNKYRNYEQKDKDTLNKKAIEIIEKNFPKTFAFLSLPYEKIFNLWIDKSIAKNSEFFKEIPDECLEKMTSLKERVNIIKDVENKEIPEEWLKEIPGLKERLKGRTIIKEIPDDVLNEFPSVKENLESYKKSEEEMANNFENCARNFINSFKEKTPRTRNGKKNNTKKQLDELNKEDSKKEI